MSVFYKLNIAIEKTEAFILSTSILAMMLNTTTNALSRYLIGQSMYFSEEINRFLIIAVTFVGLAYGVRKGRNIRMTALYDALSSKHKKYLTTFIAITSSIIMFALAYEAILYILHIKQINRLSPSLQIPVYTIFIIIPIGFMMAGLQYFIRFVQNLIHPEIYSGNNLIEEKE